MANGKARRQRCGLRASVVERDTSSLAQHDSLHHHSWPRHHGGPSGGGVFKTQLCLPRGASATIRRVRRAAPQQQYRYADSVHPSAALANKPMTAQVVPALCASSFRLCSSCSHTRSCIWRPILVHELCHVAALRHSHESTTLHLSA